MNFGYETVKLRTRPGLQSPSQISSSLTLALPCELRCLTLQPPRCCRTTTRPGTPTRTTHTTQYPHAHQVQARDQQAKVELAFAQERSSQELPGRHTRYGPSDESNGQFAQKRLVLSLLLLLGIFSERPRNFLDLQFRSREDFPFIQFHTPRPHCRRTPR